VLVVDDERAIRELVCELLSTAGYRATGVGTADAAVATLEKLTPQLVLTDLTMPGRSGVELLEELGRRVPGVPVLLLSGADGGGELRAALDRGAAGFVAKPFTGAQLLEAVRAALAGEGA